MSFVKRNATALRMEKKKNEIKKWRKKKKRPYYNPSLVLTTSASASYGILLLFIYISDLVKLDSDDNIAECIHTPAAPRGFVLTAIKK